MSEIDPVSHDERRLMEVWMLAGEAPASTQPWGRIAAPRARLRLAVVAPLVALLAMMVITATMAAAHIGPFAPPAGRPAPGKPVAQLPPPTAAATPAPTPHSTGSPATPTPRPAPTATPRASSAPARTPTPAPAAPPVSGWPNGGNTGVPAGVTLTPHPGDLIVTTAGAHYDALDIHGCVSIQANNVVITRSRITTATQCGGQWRVYVAGSTSGTVFQDVELDGLNNGSWDGFGDGQLTCIRCNIHGVAGGIELNHGGTITDSYIHDLVGGSANDIGSEGNNGAATVIRHNSLDNQTGSDACIMLSPDFDPLSNWTIDDNRLDGGGYSFYGGQGYAYPAGHVTFTNNRFRRSPTGGYFPNGGSYGPDAHWGAAGGNVWSGNVWDYTGALLAP